MNKPLRESINIQVNNRVFAVQVDYERIPFQCSLCHQVGHVRKFYPKLGPPMEKQGDEKKTILDHHIQSKEIMHPQKEVTQQERLGKGPQSEVNEDSTEQRWIKRMLELVEDEGPLKKYRAMQDMQEDPIAPPRDGVKEAKKERFIRKNRFDALIQDMEIEEDSVVKEMFNQLYACATPPALEQGKQLHAHSISTGLESYVSVGNALLTMYTNWGSILDARHMFEIMSERDTVTWNSMISGYTQGRHAEEALKVFYKMKSASLNSDQLTFISVLSECDTMPLLEQSKQAKCGSIEHAYQVFVGMPDQDAVSWNAMILDVAHHGRGLASLQLFKQMVEAGMKPDHITCIAILSACSHAVWGPFLGACRTHGNMKLGKLAVECLIKLEPQNAASYVLQGAARLRSRTRLMKEAGYVADINFVLHDVEEEHKKYIVCHHSEKLAIAFGLISTSCGTAIRIF
eukprot:Gb_24918 [translate_table: standard]